MEAFKTTKIEEEVIEEVEVKVEECMHKEGFAPKAKAWFEKHGGKLAIAAGIIGSVVIGYKFGKANANGSNFLIDEDTFEDALEIAEDAVSIETE